MLYNTACGFLAAKKGSNMFEKEYSTNFLSTFNITEREYYL